MMKKRLLSMFSAIALVLSLFTLLPEGMLKAEALSTYLLKVGGVQVTSENKTDILGNGEASYNSSTKTLTIQKDITNPDPSILGCVDNEIDGLTIIAKNAVTLTSDEQAIRSVGHNLTIKGGKYTLDAQKCGIYCSNCTVTIKDADIETTSNCKWGISGRKTNDKLIINNSKVKVNENPDCYCAVGEFASEIELLNCFVSSPEGGFPGKYATNNYCILKAKSVRATQVTILPYNISLGNTPLTYENHTDILEDGTASFDYETRTLTLNGAITSGRFGLYNRNIKGLTIVVNGECGFTSGTSTTTGLYVLADTTITGTGKVTFASTYGTDNGSGIIIGKNTTLTLDNANVIANGTKTGINGLDNSKLVVNGSALTAAGLSETDGVGIDGVKGGITLSGCEYVTPLGAVITNGTVYNSNGRTKAKKVEIAKRFTVTFSGTNAYIDQEPNPYKKLTSGNEVPVGSKVRLIYESDTVIPSGKYVTGFTSDQVTIQKDGVGYYFVMPDKSVTITPSYGTQQSHVINLSSGNAVTLTANESSTIRMLSGEYSDQIAYINNMGYDLDKNGTADFQKTYDSSTNTESLVKLSTNSVNGEISFDVKNAPYSPLTFRMSNVTNYDLYIAGTQVTSLNCTDILGDGIFEYIPSTNTLTVKGDYTYNHAEHGYRTANVIKNGIKGLTIKTTKPLLLKNNASNVIYTTEDINIRTNGLLTIEAYNIAVFTNPNESGAASNVTVTDSDIYVADSYYGFSKYSGNSYLYANNSNIKVITRARNSIDLTTSLTNCKLITLTDNEALIVRNTFSLYVAGTQVTSMNYADILGDGVFSYDPTANTLYVNGGSEFKLNYPIINRIDGLTIMINKDCRFAEGFYLIGNTTITGPGTLTIDAPAGHHGITMGGSNQILTIKNADICINGGAFSIVTENGKTNSLGIINSNITAESSHGFLNNKFKNVTLTGCALKTPSDGIVDSTGIYNSDGTTAPKKVEIVPTSAMRQVGDVNGDGKVSADDAIIVARYAANYNNYHSIYHHDICDMNCDGKVTTDDAIIIARYAAGYGNYREIYTKYVREPDIL